MLPLFWFFRGIGQRWLCSVGRSLVAHIFITMKVLTFLLGASRHLLRWRGSSLPFLNVARVWETLTISALTLRFGSQFRMNADQGQKCVPTPTTRARLPLSKLVTRSRCNYAFGPSGPCGIAVIYPQMCMRSRVKRQRLRVSLTLGRLSRDLHISLIFVTA